MINAIAFATQRLDNHKHQQTYHMLQLVQLLSLSVERNRSPCSNAINNQLFNTKEMHQYNTEILPFNPITIYLYKCYLRKLYRVPLNRGNARFTQLLKSEVINYNNILKTPIFFFARVKVQ